LGKLILFDRIANDLLIVSFSYKTPIVGTDKVAQSTFGATTCPVAQTLIAFVFDSSIVLIISGLRWSTLGRNIQGEIPC